MCCDRAAQEGGDEAPPDGAIPRMLRPRDPGFACDQTSDAAILGERTRKANNEWPPKHSQIQEHRLIQIVRSGAAVGDTVAGT